MRPRLCWADLRGRRVGVWGLGVEGQANVAMLERLGVAPVVVADEAALAGGGLGALARCDVVVKSPGISRYRPEAMTLTSTGVLLVGGLGLWLEGADRRRVAMITGTKGKSTTTSIAGHLLRRFGYRTFVGGNIGVPPYGGEDSSYDWWVIEVSSYQATDVTCSPRVVAVTSLHEDHLPWHGGRADTYFADKLSLTALPGLHTTIVNGEDSTVRAYAALLGGDVVWLRDDEDASWTRQLGLPGRHNRVNALLAGAVLRALGVHQVDDPRALAGAAEEFEPLPSRLTTVATIAGVDFVDDSLSTNVLPTIAALEAFPGRHVALIVGGEDRGIDYTELAAHIKARPTSTTVCTIPDSGPRIANTLRAEGVEAAACNDLAQAVVAAFSAAQPGGVVLLSPAAPSFGVFRDYKDRAAAFRAAIQHITP